MRLHHYHPFMRTLLIIIALLLCFGCRDQPDSKLSADGNGDNSQPANTDPNASGRNGEPTASFEPALLLSSKQTIQFAVEIPKNPEDEEKPEVIRVLLEGRTPHVLTLRIVAECATRRCQKELQSKIPEMKAAIVDHISGKTPTWVTSTEGRLKLKEEILLLMQRQMHNKAIKQIYFIQYFVAPGKI